MGNMPTVPEAFPYVMSGNDEYSVARFRASM
jgi:hypothetical protein